MHILLVGQDGLVERLTSETQNALYQRISCRVFLRRMDTDLVRDFIRFRLERAGAKDNCFDPLAIEMITIASDGIPRLVNMICNAALVEAYEDDSAQVQPSHVFAATRELGIDNEHISIMYDELYDKNPKEAIDDYMFREKFETGASEGQRKLLWTMRK